MLGPTNLARYVVDTKELLDSASYSLMVIICNGKHNELCSKPLMPKCPKIGGWRNCALQAHIGWWGYIVSCLSHKMRLEKRIYNLMVSTMNSALNLWCLNVQRLVGKDAVPCKTMPDCWSNLTPEKRRLVWGIWFNSNHYNGEHNELCLKSLMPSCPKIGEWRNCALQAHVWLWRWHCIVSITEDETCKK